MQRIVILGAGPAGLGAAFRLAKRSDTEVIVIERQAAVGGNAGSFEIDGIRVDYGSHRLHPICDPEVMKDIRKLLGDDLLYRERHGRILLRGRWIHFPLKMFDLIFSLPPPFILGVASDSFTKLLFKKSASLEEETFASILGAGLGKTICRDFYFPYATKIWGLPPEKLSVIQANRRISGSTVSKILKMVFAKFHSSNSSAKNHYLYPRFGYGQISESYAKAARQMGVQFSFHSTVRSIITQDNTARAVEIESAGKSETIETDQVWSTIPVTILGKSLRPSVPEEILSAASAIRYRAMILIYLVVEQERFSPYDAHYFPELSMPITRLSEPKNFSDGQGTQDLTVLCAELPCSIDSHEWSMSDEELGKLVSEALESAGIGLRSPVRKVLTRRLRQAYPVYERGYEKYFDRLDEWIDGIDRLITFGRQGLFAHDNTHHALYMGYAAEHCLTQQGFDREKWRQYREIFNTHVVED